MVIKVEILEFKPMENTSGVVRAYLHTPLTEDHVETRRLKYPSVVICPGGAYAMVSTREADPVALEYIAAGYNTFILDYSVGEEAKGFVPLMEISKTVMKIREMSDEWSCDPNQIVVCGFSAGGHLAGSLATMWDDAELKKVFDNENGKNMPNGAILAYPVITASEYAHVESIENVSGAKEGTEKYKYFSLEDRVDKKTCPVFLWHTADDETVPVENAILMTTALVKSKVSCESHIFPTGKHGLSTCTIESGRPNAYDRKWMSLSISWLNELFNYKL